MTIRHGFLLVMLCLCPLLTAAKDVKKTSTKSTTPKKQTAASLDKDVIQSLYQEGDFEQLVALLENIRRERQMRNREDSIFIYKYLGVIYGADEVTKKKAESFLYQMLKLDPGQNLSRLSVGDSIEAIFSRVRMRFEEQEGVHIARQSAKDSAKLTGNNASLTPTSPKVSSSQSKSNKTWLWVAGGAAAAATITGIVLYAGSSNAKSKTNTIDGGTLK